MNKSHSHGICFPLSALRTASSSGIGEFLDLIPVIDWCHEIKADIIQLLPLNDTGSDASPYNPLSSCALHPIYLSLHALPYLEKTPDLAKELSLFSSMNQLPRVSYQQVLRGKKRWLRKYFAEVGALLVQEKDYKDFLNKYSWVLPYARFKALKENSKDPSEISFYSVLQHLCFSQMKEVKQYASSKNIYIKGDISFLISRESADCKLHPELFDFTFAAGAPPDAHYNTEGQYWGFPLYNWEKMRETHFAWWKQRLQVASEYYDLYRIDHATGFFRIWAIPPHESAKAGKYLPKDTSLWLGQGKEILQTLLQAVPIKAVSEDIPIGEDAAEILPAIQTCLQELGILSTKIMRFERRKDGSFIPLHDYPEQSMTSVSNHDFEPLQLWWQKFPAVAKTFAASKNWTYASHLTFDQRLEILQDSHKTSSVLHINPLQEYLALFPELISPHPEDERINIPGTVLPTNWTYRFRTFFDSIATHEGLKIAMHTIFNSQ